jgi:5'-nucleotidase
VEVGYPKELANTKFLPDFAVRGLIFDKKMGNFLKLDLHGLVLTACRGTRGAISVRDAVSFFIKA